MLRALIHHWPLPLGLLTLVILALIPDVVRGQDPAEGADVPFADGATGPLLPDIAEKVYQAERDGAALKDRLSIQDPMAYTPPVDFNALRQRALNDPRVRKLLGADGPETNPYGPDQGERWEGARVWALASFSMPEPSLKQLMLDAKAYGVPVVMRGFVDNSVYATRERLIAVFGSDEEIEGFGIDPTLFARFDVTTVPTIIAVPDMFDICDTPGCEGDAAPLHDRVSGNIRLEHALRMIAATGDAARAAAHHLSRKDTHRP